MVDKILEWKKLTNSITEDWVKQYFELEEDEEVSADWVANDIGGVFEFADMYFGFDTVLKCYELSISREQLFNWYYYTLENEFVNISLARFILSPQERKEQEEKQLEQLRERLNSTKEELEKAIERHNEK